MKNLGICLIFIITLLNCKSRDGHNQPNATTLSSHNQHDSSYHQFKIEKDLLKVTKRDSLKIILNDKYSLYFDNSLLVNHFEEKIISMDSIEFFVLKEKVNGEEYDKIFIIDDFYNKFRNGMFLSIFYHGSRSCYNGKVDLNKTLKLYDSSKNEYTALEMPSFFHQDDSEPTAVTEYYILKQNDIQFLRNLELNCSEFTLGLDTSFENGHYYKNISLAEIERVTAFLKIKIICNH